MKFFWFVILLGGQSLAMAETHQSLDTITLLVEKKVMEGLASESSSKLSVKAGPINKHLILHACPIDKISVTNPYKSNLIESSMMNVQCTLKKHPWTIYVPISIELRGQVLTSNRTIQKGQLIRSEDLVMVEKNIKILKHPYLTESNDSIGKIAKQTILPGTIIESDMLAIPVLVHQGDIVSIQAKMENIMVSMDGTALGNGGFGDTIRVKNNHSKRMIMGKISGDKQVDIVLQ